MNAGFMDRVRSAGKGLLGTWVKIPAFETVELLAHAGFDFVVIDMEHSPLALDRVYELVFATQRMGMAALVRLPDQLGTPVQPLLDAGADGLLVPRVASLDAAAAIAARMVFSPAGERGLGFTSRAGRWALMPGRESWIVRVPATARHVCGCSSSACITASLHLPQVPCGRWNTSVTTSMSTCGCARSNVRGAVESCKASLSARIAIHSACSAVHPYIKTSPHPSASA